MAHIPVLKDEVIKYLDPRPGENFIDGTCGGGGHAQEILKHITPGGRILCLDLDKETIERLQKKINGERVAGRMIFVNDNFGDLEKIVQKNNFSPVNGILLDLGMSSDQLEESGRGFSFLKDEPLDMRYWQSNEITAHQIVNQWSPLEIEKILEEYGEEKFARKISLEIGRARKLKSIQTTRELLEVIGRAVPEKYKHGRTNFATRTFQALRIAVNDELENLKKFLPQSLRVLAGEGCLVIISFQSLEDRIVKNFFRQSAKEKKLEILTKKPLTPTGEEIFANPRSRSAKLRAVKLL